MKSFKQYLSLISSLLFMVACTSSQLAANKPAPFEKNQQHLIRINNMTASFQTPTSAIDIFKNIELAFNQGWLHRDDFYSEENIKAFFGCNTVKLREDNRYFFDVSDCVFAPKLFIRGGKDRKDQDISIILNNNSSNKADDHSELSFTNMNQIFGKQWQSYNIISLEDSESYTYFYGYDTASYLDKPLQVRFTFSSSNHLTEASFIEAQ